mmetsp:Transcript_12533/g.32829  ORF Transcript_12533/g.32829 Transcript_12533/m.32829 type:complete len:329 (+) Transcript_12533:178-1164(+)
MSESAPVCSWRKYSWRDAYESASRRATRKMACSCSMAASSCCRRPCRAASSLCTPSNGARIGATPSSMGTPSGRKSNASPRDTSASCCCIAARAAAMDAAESTARASTSSRSLRRLRTHSSCSRGVPSRWGIISSSSAMGASRARMSPLSLSYLSSSFAVTSRACSRCFTSEARLERLVMSPSEDAIEWTAASEMPSLETSCMSLSISASSSSRAMIATLSASLSVSLHARSRRSRAPAPPSMALALVSASTSLTGSFLSATHASSACGSCSAVSCFLASSALTDVSSPSLCISAVAHEWCCDSAVRTADGSSPTNPSGGTSAEDGSG